jgi:hypothetical protein
MCCNRFLFSIIELIAECLNSLLRRLMIPLIVVLTRRVAGPWRSLSCWPTYGTCVEGSLMALIYLRLLSISWRAGLRYFWGNRIVFWLFYDIWSTLMMLVLLTKRCYLLSLSFKTLENSVWINIFLIFKGSLWTLCNWWFTHHWWFGWETLGSVVSSRNSIIFGGVNICSPWLSWRSTWKRNSYLLFLLFFIFSRS